MNKKKIASKIELLKSNPRILLYWGYKIINLFKMTPLNNGERYDPNILKKFNINDPHQECRYKLAVNLISRNDIVLDIACGTGYGTLILADKSFSIKGVDISKRAIKYAKKNYKRRPNIDFIQSDLFNFNESADIVVSFETIEHIPRDIEDIVVKLMSLARKRLVCSVPYMEVAGDNRYHVHFNINETNFDFLKNFYQVKFLYQSATGEISDCANEYTMTLIMIIDRNLLNI